MLQSSTSHAMEWPQQVISRLFTAVCGRPASTESPRPSLAPSNNQVPFRATSQAQAHTLAALSSQPDRHDQGTWPFRFTHPHYNCCENSCSASREPTLPGLLNTHQIAKQFLIFFFANNFANSYLNKSLVT